MINQDLNQPKDKQKPLFVRAGPFDPSVLSSGPSKPLWLKMGFGGVLVVLTGMMVYVLSEPLSRPKNISVSNVSASSITLSWTTGAPDETKLVLTEANLAQYLPFFFYPVIPDDRDNEFGFNPKRNTHYVTLKNLKPSTRYIAKIYSGLRQVHTQKLTTGPQLILAEPNLVYGKVTQPQASHPDPPVFDREAQTESAGGEGSVKPKGAEGVLVYLRLVSKKGSSSALLSDITDEKGSWSIETSNARIRNLKKSFDQKDLSYELLVIDNGKGKRFKATTTPKGDKPWPTIVLTASASGELKNE